MTQYVSYFDGEKIDLDYFRRKPSLLANHANKPEGAVWASLLDEPSNYFSWRRWVLGEEFYERPENEWTRVVFHLKKNARVFNLHTPDAFQYLVDNFKAEESGWLDDFPFSPFRSSEDQIDWGKVAKHYDVIDFEVNELYRVCYGWDCDCIVVLNKDVIVVDDWSGRNVGNAG